MRSRTSCPSRFWTPPSLQRSTGGRASTNDGRVSRQRLARRRSVGQGPTERGAQAVLWQIGVSWADEERADLLAFALEGTGDAFSPTTRYSDYATRRDLIHWESQNLTRADSLTARRYQQHAAQGSSVMLFTRLRDDDRAFYFLAPATYVSHELERPMAITWRLKHPLPGALFAALAAAVP